MAATALTLLAASAVVVGERSGGPEETAAEASFPVVLNPDICAALRRDGRRSGR
jgi:hypothetical protein